MLVEILILTQWIKYILKIIKLCILVKEMSKKYCFIYKYIKFEDKGQEMSSFQNKTHKLLLIYKEQFNKYKGEIYHGITFVSKRALAKS